jgi:hypothetical protein
MDKLTLYEDKEYGYDYLVVQCDLENLDFVPTFIRTTLEYLLLNRRYVKVFKTDGLDSETEYFEHSVRSNKKGAAYINKDGKKYFFILGKETEDTDKLLNNDRSKVLREIFN